MCANTVVEVLSVRSGFSGPISILKTIFNVNIAKLTLSDMMADKCDVLRCALVGFHVVNVFHITPVELLGRGRNS